MFTIKKSFKLLSLVLSGSILLSFLTPSMFALAINSISQEALELILPKPRPISEQEAWEQVNNPSDENQPSIITATEEQRLVNEVKYELELRINNTKRDLKNYTFSDNDLIYLRLSLQSAFENLIHFLPNLDPLDIEEKIKEITYIEEFVKTKAKKVNEYRSKHPKFPIINPYVIYLSSFFTDTFVHIFCVSYSWRNEPFLFARYFANYILSEYLQKFVNYVCKNHTFTITWSY